VGGVTLPLATLGGQVRAFDIDQDDLSELRERAGEKGLDNILATREDGLTFLDGRLYDVVVASEIFEHLQKPDRLAMKCAEHLAPGGILIVTTPNGYGPWETVNSIRLIPHRWKWLRRLAGRPPHDGGGREHEQRYTRARLAELFAEQGLRPEYAANSDFVLTVSQTLREGQTSGRIDCKLADHVPHWMASGWYMVFRKGIE
jgi:2-polyprenyl-3-methyl-5-hydroxy-6-metoxy-1,4-benzoquinol methylase